MSGATRSSATGVRSANKPITRRRKSATKTSAAAKVAAAEEGQAPDIIMKEQDIPAIMEAAAEPATADVPAGADMEIQEEDTDGDGGGLEVSDIIQLTELKKKQTNKKPGGGGDTLSLTDQNQR